jgi:hypothetical protein
MFICGTIVYSHDNPARYDLYKTETDCELKPAANTKSNLTPPLITITPADSGWAVIGVQNEDVKEQVVKLVSIQKTIHMPGNLSAAS